MAVRLDFEIFLADRNEEDKKQIKTKLDILVRYLAGETDDLSNFGMPALPDCPECYLAAKSNRTHNGNSVKAVSSPLKLLGGSAGNSSDAMYFLSCERNLTHLFVLRIIK